MVLPFALCQVNFAVLQIGHRTRGMGQVAHVMEAETEVLSDVGNDVLAEWTSGVADPLEDLLRLRLILREIVAALTHHGPQLAVRAAGLFRRRHLLVHLRSELVQQPDLCLQDVHRQPRTDADFGQVERLVERSALVALELDFQACPAAGRFGSKQLVDADVERRCQVLQQAEFGFPLAILNEAQLARGGSDGGTQVIQRKSRLLAQMAHAAAERDNVQFRRRLR